MNNRDLEQLDDATEEDLVFAVGTLMMPGGPEWPYLHIHYAVWTREKLTLVRNAFCGGLILVMRPGPGDRSDMYLATRERVSIQVDYSGQTSVLRAPAWDARLEGVETAAMGWFLASRAAVGGYIVVLQTPDWEFLATHHDPDGRLVVGPVQHRSMAIPPTDRVR